MSISYREQDNTSGLPVGILEIDYGDLEALKTVMEQYNFVDQQALLRYALVALLRADDNKLYIKQAGSIVSLNVSEELIKKSDSVSE